VAFGSEALPSQVNGKTVNVTTQDMGGSIYKITSVATTNSNSNTTISSYVLITAGIFEYDYGMLALDGNITLSGNTEVTTLEILGGDVYANGDINMSGNSEVHGDVILTGEVTKTGNADIGGSIEELAQPSVFAAVDTQAYLNQANQGTLITGDKSYSGNGYYYLGPAHITGNLTISSNAILRLTGTVWVDGTISMSGNTRIEGPYTMVAIGNISVSGNTKLNPDNIPFIISTTGSITTTGNSWISAALYAPNGNIRMSGNSNIYGCAIGKSITASGNHFLQYVSLDNRSNLPHGGLDIISWQIS
jgi:hypothetical protein